MSLLECENISLSFAGVQAIDGVSFVVEADEVFAIIGPNGAGKTSLFNVLSGVYKPQQGSVRLDGENLIGAKPDRVAAKGLARTFQNIELFANLTVVENLLLGRHHHNGYGLLAALAWFGRALRSELENRLAVEDVIDLLELESWRHSPVAQLPYGIQKRVELGRALAMEPRILMLDEPVAGMNQEETEDMARFILDVRDETGVSIIIVEHDMGLVMDIADRVMAVDFGHLLAIGAPVVIQNHPDVIRAYLGKDSA